MQVTPFRVAWADLDPQADTYLLDSWSLAVRSCLCSLSDLGLGLSAILPGASDEGAFICALLSRGLSGLVMAVVISSEIVIADAAIECSKVVVVVGWGAHLGL